MEESNKRLTVNIIFTGLMQFCNYLIPFLVIPFISRRVGIEKMATIEFINSIVQFGIVIINYGFDLSASRRTSINRNSKESLNLIFNAVSIIKLILLFISVVSLFFSYIFIPSLHNVSSGLIGAVLIFIGFSINPWWFYQGIEKLKTVSIANALIKVLSGVIMIIIIQAPEQYYLYFVAIGVTQIVISVFYYLKVIKDNKFKLFFPKLSYLISTLKDGLALFISELSILFFTYTNVLILGTKLSNYELAQYTTPNRILIIIQTLVIASFQKGLYPYLTNLFKQSKDKYFIFMKKVKYLIVGLMVLCSLFVFFFNELIITILFGQEHLVAVPVLNILAFIFPFIGLANIYGWQGLLVMKKDKLLTLTTIILGIVNIILLYIIPLSPYNMAILRVTMEFLLAIVCYMLFSKELKSAKKESINHIKGKID